MKRTKESTEESNKQDVKLRKSEILADKITKLPAELTTKIFSKMEDDPKTLIRCSAVCKNWGYFVSKTVNLSLRFLSTGEKGESLPCSKRHYHIPVAAIPSIMKVFANLESLKIKLCRFPSATSQPPCCQNFNQIKVEWDGDDYHTYTCTAFEVGLLSSSIKGAVLFHDFSRNNFATIHSFSVTYFYWKMLDHRPKTLSSMVIMSSKMERSRSGGKVFLKYEQLPNLRDSVSNSKVNKSWLEDPQHVVHWHKNHSAKNHLLQEQVWLVYEWKYFVANKELDQKELDEKELSAKKTDFTELLDGLDYDAGGDRIRKRRTPCRQKVKRIKKTSLPHIQQVHHSFASLHSRHRALCLNGSEKCTVILAAMP
ncbi:unnamed protein product [Dovyalis caffra]|uniref:F-box domain-containing protein n=1 Tax=Dovyalis caffra TaxID=77055 RepID=A0AAV1RRP4_9ROSI|nr:unnamed protein product [Dovyalis caffra]